MACRSDPGGNRGTEKKRLTTLGVSLFDPEGRAPPEAVIDAICQAFSCAPDVALRQDPILVFSILEHRIGVAAIQQHNRDVTKLSKASAAFLVELAQLAEDAGLDAKERLGAMKNREQDG